MIDLNDFTHICGKVIAIREGDATNSNYIHVIVSVSKLAPPNSEERYISKIWKCVAWGKTADSIAERIKKGMWFKAMGDGGAGQPWEGKDGDIRVDNELRISQWSYAIPPFAQNLENREENEEEEPPRDNQNNRRTTSRSNGRQGRNATSETSSRRKPRDEEEEEENGEENSQDPFVKKRSFTSPLA